MDLQLKVQEKFAEIIDEGYVDTIVKNALQSTVKEIVGNSLRSYSDFSKQLEKHIADGMGVNLSKLSLDHYNDIVLRVVQQELNGTVLESAQARIRERVQKLLGTLEKKEWKLSEIIAKFREENRDSYHGDSERIGLEVRESEYGGGFHIYFDSEEKKSSGLYSSTKKSWTEYDYQIHTDKAGKPYTFNIKGESMDFTRSCVTGFDAFFFQLYANGATIEVDEDDCILEYNEEYD